MKAIQEQLERVQAQLQRLQDLVQRLSSSSDAAEHDALLEKIAEQYADTFHLLEEYDRGSHEASETLDRPSRVTEILRRRASED